MVGEEGRIGQRMRVVGKRGGVKVRCGKQPRSRRGPRSAYGDNCDRESRRGNAPDDRPRRAIRIELARVLNISHAETSRAVASRETDRARVRAAGKKGPRYLGFYPAKNTHHDGALGGLVVHLLELADDAAVGVDRGGAVEGVEAELEVLGGLGEAERVEARVTGEGTVEVSRGLGVRFPSVPQGAVGTDVALALDAGGAAHGGLALQALLGGGLLGRGGLLLEEGHDGVGSDSEGHDSRLSTGGSVCGIWLDCARPLRRYCHFRREDAGGLETKLVLIGRRIRNGSCARSMRSSSYS